MADAYCQNPNCAGLQSHCNITFACHFLFCPAGGCQEFCLGRSGSDLKIALIDITELQSFSDSADRFCMKRSAA